jgi:hypothetical protein
MSRGLIAGARSQALNPPMPAVAAAIVGAKVRTGPRNIGNDIKHIP